MRKLVNSIVTAIVVVATVAVFGSSAQAQAVPNYVALGDSFSSGNGADIVPGMLVGDQSVYQAGTNTATNQCLRSSKAYPTLLASAKQYQLTNVSCGGATTDNILTAGQYNEAAQINAVTSSTNLVTLTIGGNDVGFTGFVACVLTKTCTTTSSEIITTNAALDTLQPKLDAVLQAIKTKAPNAQVRIAGYPQIVPSKGQTALGCRPWLSQAEQELANNVETRLNGMIKTAAETAGSNFQYVDPFAATSPFMTKDRVGLSKDACSLSAIRAINGVRADFSASSFHPNIYGHQHYKTLFSASL